MFVSAFSSIPNFLLLLFYLHHFNAPLLTISHFIVFHFNLSSACHSCFSALSFLANYLSPVSLIVFFSDYRAISLLCCVFPFQCFSLYLSSFWVWVATINSYCLQSIIEHSFPSIQSFNLSIGLRLFALSRSIISSSSAFVLESSCCFKFTSHFVTSSFLVSDWNWCEEWKGEEGSCQIWCIVVWTVAMHIAVRMTLWCCSTAFHCICCLSAWWVNIESNNIRTFRWLFWGNSQTNK